MLLLRVILPDRAERLDLPERPSSVEELRDILTDKFQLPPGFSLTYDDTEFDNAPCNLGDIQYLKGKATLRVVWQIVLTTVPIDSIASTEESLAEDSDINVAEDSDINVENEITPSPASSASSASSSQRKRSSQFPAIFTVPTFSYTLELKLRSGGAAYAESNTLMAYTREMKSEILTKLAEDIYAYEAYPTEDDLEKVAKALVQRHPCIGNAGPGKPWEVWKTSLKHKMNNYRQALANAGCTEVRVNKRPRGTTDVKLKRPRRAEINFLPDHPDGFGDVALESERVWLQDELKKRIINMAEVNAKMDHTFSLRRKEIVCDDDAHVSTTMQRWPALFLLDQVYAEFQRITGIDLMPRFIASLDEHTRGLIRVYRSVAHHPSQEPIRKLMEYLDDQTTDIVKHRRVVAVKGLQYYLGEKTRPLFKTCQRDGMEEARIGLEMGILEVVGVPGGPESAPETAAVLDGEVVMDSLPDVPSALAVLFGFIYALNINYPKYWVNFFEVIQKLFMSLDAESGGNDKLDKLRTKLSQI